MNRRRIMTLGIGAAIGLLATEVFPRWAWGRTHRRESSAYHDNVNFVGKWADDSGLKVKSLKVEEQQVAGLAYHQAQRYFLTDGPDQGMELLYLEYDEGSPHYFEDLFYHTPERCMAATGKVVDLKFRHVNLVDTDVEVRCVTFREMQSGRLLYVYKAIWLHREFPVRLGAAMHLRKFQAALAFKPNPPARMLMAAVFGAESEEAAWNRFRGLGLSRLTEVSEGQQ